jgi:hypothetical protein
MEEKGKNARSEAPGHRLSILPSISIARCPSLQQARLFIQWLSHLKCLEKGGEAERTG